mmetsp:Transcript_38209/g.87007  ORF Transcript_38209/g.87007 Transcript_38209/m.87007 type:complete len:270 (+) Transcript_38209:832-1641(+)
MHNRKHGAGLEGIPDRGAVPARRFTRRLPQAPGASNPVDNSARTGGILGGDVRARATRAAVRLIRNRDDQLRELRALPNREPRCVLGLVPHLLAVEGGAGLGPLHASETPHGRSVRARQTRDRTRLQGAADRTVLHGGYPRLVVCRPRHRRILVSRAGGDGVPVCLLGGRAVPRRQRPSVDARLREDLLQKGERHVPVERAMGRLGHNLHHRVRRHHANNASGARGLLLRRCARDGVLGVHDRDVCHDPRVDAPRVLCHLLRRPREGKT